MSSYREMLEREYPPYMVDANKLVGAHEVLELAGWKQRRSIAQAMKNRGFPQPVAKLRAGQVWDGGAVRAWLASHGR